ncbi:MAG: glycosyltransferase family 2 protein [Blastocatellia bacterium]
MKNLTSTVAIALCTYNGARYLPEQLDSYLRQTRQPDEMVICDDGSRDETATIWREFAGRAPFAVTIRVQDRNLGTIKNFETAISLCSSDLIFLSDQDDVWEADKIEKFLWAFQNSPEAGMVFSNAELVDEALRPLGRNLYDRAFTDEERRLLNEGHLFPTLLKRDVVIGAALAFRVEFRDRIIPIPSDVPGMIHDGWIAVVISALAPVVYLDQPLIKYRQHGEQQTGVMNYVPRKSRLGWVDAMRRVASGQQDRRKYVESLRDRLVSRMPVPQSALEALGAEISYRKEYIEHYQVRGMLPGNKAARVRRVVKELCSGRYHRFSNGIRSAIRDVLADHAGMTEFNEIVDRRRA